LKKHYSQRDELAPLFWTATAWGSMLGVTEQMDQAVDLPAVRVMVEHVVAIEPGYEDGAGLVFLGGVYSQTPADYGGDPVKGKAFFERALQLTQRKSYMVQPTTLGCTLSRSAIASCFTICSTRCWRRKIAATACV
jgi:hypothetical protein